MNFAILRRGDIPWLSFKHEALGTSYQPLFSLSRHEEIALQTWGFGEVKNSPSGQRVVHPEEAGRASCLSAAPHPEDPGQWVIALYPGQVLGQVPAEIAALFATTPDVEFPDAVTPATFLLSRADALDREAVALEVRAAELRAEAEAIREKTPAPNTEGMSL